MKVVTAHTMQEIDKRAIEEFGIPGLKLMESAGVACVEVILREFGNKGRAVILAGKGNNGGDGYVIGRLLLQEGWDVSIVILAEKDEISGDAARNLEMLPPEIVSFSSQEGTVSALYGKKINQADLIVDALFGTGLRNDICGIFLEAVNLVNSSGRKVLSVDIPSGVHGTTGKILGGAVRADITVTFAFAKLGHVLYPGVEKTGKLLSKDIGIPAELMMTPQGYEFLNVETIRPMLRRRDRLAHKGSYGHCLIVAGSIGKTGAAALSANSAVRGGAGLVTLAVAGSIHNILEIKTTEAMTYPLPDSGSGHLTNSAFADIEKLLYGKTAVAIGPGLDRRPGTSALVQNLVENIHLPLVIDADALNALSDDINVLLRKKSASVILTPHPGEMSRMMGTPVPGLDEVRISTAQEFSIKYGVYVILKGARTIVAAPDGTCAINGSGNPGMATGGMGDVLTGLIVALLGQGYSAWEACCLGVFLHGYAGDMVASDKGECGMNASDVQEKLPFALKELLLT